MMDFGKELLRLRKAKGVTQEMLADQLGVTAAAVSKWEKNYTLPDLLMLSALADYFEVSTDELLGRRQRLKKAVIAAPMELAKQIEALARPRGYVTAAICDTYEQALALAREDPQIAHIFLSGAEPNPALEADEEHPGLQVLEAVGDTEEQTLLAFQWLMDAQPNS